MFLKPYNLQVTKFRHSKLRYSLYVGFIKETKKQEILSPPVENSHGVQKCEYSLSLSQKI